MLRNIQPRPKKKEEPVSVSDSGDHGKERPNGKNKGGPEPVPVAGDGGGDLRVKSLHDKTEHQAARPVIIIPTPVPVSTLPALEKTSPAASPVMGKTTYNPITHVASEYTNTQNSTIV